MLFNSERESRVETLERKRSSLLFDWDEKEHLMEDGSPALTYGVDAVKGWLNLLIRTRREEVPIYPADFGCSALDLLSRKIPSGSGLPQLEAELQESARYCDEVSSIGNVQFDGASITAVVTLQSGESEVISVGS